MSHSSKVAERLGKVGWGLFLIWVGVLFVGELSTAIGFLGFGLITLGVQVARRSAGLKFERFWVVAGVLFIAVAVWEYLNPGLPLISVILILLGVAVIRSAVWRR
jgi:hypothetical protein